jgi:hypothetical protein
MSSARSEFYSNVQIARRRIFKRYLILILCSLAGYGAVWQLDLPFPIYASWAIFMICGIVLLSSPIRKLEKMPCPYCHYSARVGILPFRQFRCMHCHRSIGEGVEANQGG